MRTSAPTRFREVVDGKTVDGLRASVSEQRSRAVRELWLAVDAADAAHLSDRQDVFVPALALLAMLEGEDLDLGGIEIDRTLLRNLSMALRQYAAWYPKYQSPELSNFHEVTARENGAGIAAFCSGGIDGLFTVLRHTAAYQDHPCRSSAQDLTRVMHVLYTESLVGIPAFGAAGNALSDLASGLGLALTKVYSNIYPFSPAQKRNYAMVTHAAAFASLAHALSRETAVTLLASSHTFGQLSPYGSTPEVDPLYSSAAMRFMNDGSTFERLEKTDLLARNMAALKALNVCDRRANGADYANCSRCHKCLRTMVTLDLLGAAGPACPAFDWTDYTPSQFGKLQLRGAGRGGEDVFAEEIKRAADGRRADIASAATRAIARSRWSQPLFAAEDMIKRMPLGESQRRSLKSLRGSLLRAMGTHR